MMDIQEMEYNKRIEEVYGLIEDGELERALEETRLMLAEDDSNAQYWCLEGQVRLALGEVQPAERAFDRACSLAPGHPEPLFHKANYFLAIERFEDAYQQAERSLQFTEDDEDRFNAYVLLGDAQLGHARVLLEEWEAELHGVDEHGHVHHHHHMEEDHPPPPLEIIELLNEGLGSIEKAIQIEPLASEAFDLKAQFHLFLGDMDSAIASWQKAVEIAPYEGTYWHHLGNCFAAIGDVDEAYKAFRELFDMEVDNPEGMEFSREEFAELAKQACQDLEAEVHDQLETPVVFNVSTEDFPTEDMLEQAPKQYPFDPWIPCVITPGPSSDAHESVEFILYQRNVEREAMTDDPHEMYHFIAELLGTLLVQASEYVEEEPIEA